MGKIEEIAREPTEVPRLEYKPSEAKMLEFKPHEAAGKVGDGFVLGRGKLRKATRKRHLRVAKGAKEFRRAESERVIQARQTLQQLLRETEPSGERIRLGPPEVLRPFVFKRAESSAQVIETAEILMSQPYWMFGCEMGCNAKLVSQFN